ncbi:MAG TPA: carboxypeptidase regulatory-like domain-containing protein [Firmicutes bacterium]|nr:carboxypeptidase regulatory-like domain-containing protein [Bacillota bacterium]
MGRRGFALVFLFSAAVFVFPGLCSADAESFRVFGTVTEMDTGIPLMDAVIAIGPVTALTDARGEYWMDVPGGLQEMEVSLGGYQVFRQVLDLKQDEQMDIGLETKAPPIDTAGIGLFHPIELSELREETDYPAVLLKIDDLTSVCPPDMEPTRVELWARAVSYGVFPDWAGGLSCLVPLFPGSNSLQLRVWDADGSARSDRPRSVELTWNHMDFCAVLSWDGAADLDLRIYSPDQELGDPGAASTYTPSDASLESIAVKELAPGDYQIWVEPRRLPEGTTKMMLELLLDVSLHGVDLHVFELELSPDQVDMPIHVATVQADEDGLKRVISAEH